MPGRLEGKTIIITGAAQGLGLACANLAVAEGGNAVLLDIRGEKVAAAAKALRDAGHQALGITCDVTAVDQVAAAMQQAIATFGGVDGVICCAGAGALVDFLTVTEEQLDGSYRLNLKGTFFLCQMAARHMVETKRKGALVAISSTASEIASGDMVPYSMSKAAVNGMVRAMAVALGPYGIRVNCVAPGTIQTPLLESGVSKGSKMERIMLSRSPLGRIGDPAEVATAAIYLVSDEASYITGQTLFADGGRTILGFVMPTPD